ncbi:transcription-associated protein 1, partial [Coemansia sp. RSA 1721]
PVVLEVVTTLLKLVKVENEENAVVCLKIIYELHRMYRQLLESIALPFLDLAAEIYRNADQMLKAMDSLDTPASLSTPNVNLMSPSAMSPGPDSGDMATKNLNKATTSFKVLTEIPIIVVSIIQANRRHADPFVTNILPLIIHMLELNPKSTLAHSEPIQLQHAHQYQHWRSAHADLITAQSKTLSFLAFFARGFTALLLPFQDRIARLTYQLLCLCPAESTATRKEMLIATRHIVSTEIRKAFVPIADKFLDMQVLVGSGLASQCILKPFAFSMLADLMHHIRLELSPSQLTKMVDFYAGCMHDQSLSSGVHTMCAKLLHNITERIMHIPDKRHGRILLLSILKTFVSSFAAIGNQAETAIQDIRSGGTHAEEKIYGSNELIRTNAFEQGDKIKELRFLLRSLVTGCKNVIYGLKRCDSMLGVGMEPQTNAVKTEDADAAGAKGTTESASGTSVISEAAMQDAELVGFELDLLASLFREGLRACRINDIERVKAEVAADSKSDSKGDDKLPSDTTATNGTSGNTGCSDSRESGDDSNSDSSHVLSREAQIKMLDREDKEQIEQFANLFVGLDLTVFHELFTSQFDYAFNAMIEHCTAISCVQVFVASDPNSPAFISIMLRYLCDRLDLLGSDDEVCTSTMLHLFKVAFLALALYPEANEPVLQPYVQTIINSALSIPKNAKNPKNYFLLLRALFRSIGGGRYESLYKEVFPVLQNLLETLNSALGFTKLASSMQELFVEICLTVPVRLSVLLPYLSLLMKPLVFALESGPELVSQGLRTLELCIDNLTREFLDPILTPVMDEIMSSLWLHLRLPSSASTHAPVAARILGKLGGRNRHMLLTRFPVDSSEPVSPNSASKSESDKLVVPMTFEGLPGLVSMPLMEAVMFSVKILGERVATKQLELARKDAVEFVVACARYTLVLPFVSDGKSGGETSGQSGLEHGHKLTALTADPLALKRLLNMSTPSSQGSQNLERIISVCQSVGDTFKADAPVTTSEAALTATDITLSDLCAGTAASSRNLPVSHGGLMQIIWALSLASMHSSDARDLLHSIITLSAKQHIAQCVEAISTGRSASENAAFATALANTVPEVISRVLVSHSQRLRSTGASMLQCFYKAFQELLPSKTALVGQLPAMRNIVSDLCAACYDPSVETKHSGCVGIAFIVEKLEMGRGWLADNLLELSKALLFTLKDANSSVLPGTNTDESRETLLQIIKQAFPADIFALAPEAVAELEAENSMETDGEGNNDGKGGSNEASMDVQMSDPKPSDAEAGSAAAAAATEENGESKAASSASAAKDEGVNANANSTADASTSASEGGEAKSTSKSSQDLMAASTQRATLAFKKLTAGLSLDNSRLLKSFLALITKELANPSNEVREAAKACLAILVTVTRCSVTALLLPFRDRLLGPIFGKPLRALPHNMQIGNIDAITYCLSLDPPFLEINEELLRLLSEALALADAEDQALVNHPAQVRSNTVSLTHLRHVCIRMLTAAMVRPEFSDSKNTPTRARIISVFFKSLYHKSVEVVDAANDGLKQVLLQQQKLPRDLLQTGLRPILLNLSDYKRLTVASLDGLARLLQLLTNYFKVEVGRKLLDHMQQWANPQLLQAASEKSVEDMHEIKILVAILQVFHLLPSTAGVLLDDLVGSVVNLEVHLCRRESSPFRKPLFKFLNRYPTESVMYFIKRIDSTHYMRIFTHALSSPECSPLREALFHPLWLEERSDLLQALMATWTAAHPLDMAANKSSRLAKPVLLELIVRCLLVATRAMNSPPAVLFKLLEIAGRSIDVIDVSFVFQYVWSELIVKWPISKRREILSSFLVRLSDTNVSDESNAILLQHLVNPMVATVFTLPEISVSDASDPNSATSAVRSLPQEQRGIDLLRGQVIHLINQRVWAVHMPNNAQPSSIKRASVRLELVQLSSILIRHAANAVADQRKDIIKFGWNYIRNDDIMIKNASYVLVAQFIAAFDTPPKIILQAYSSLLKAHQVESRFLVRQALDILLPVLPIRLMPSAPQQAAGAEGGGPAGSLPAWVVLAKRILIDNSASLAHTTHVYQLIAGHPEIFFPYRAQFATNLVGILQKMCLTHSATTETRTLALDIMDLFLKWHTMLEDSSKAGAGRGAETSEAQKPRNGNNASSTDSNSDANPGSKQQGNENGSTAITANGSAQTGPASPTDLLMSESRRETIVGLLLRMLCLVFDFALKSNLGPRALGLLTQYLDSDRWAPMHLRLTFFERSMQQIEAQGMNQQLVLHILTVLSAVTEQMQPVWFEEYYGILVGIVRKCMSVDNGQVQKIVASMLRQLYSQAVKNERLGSTQVVTDLKAHVEAAISKNLLDNTNVYGTLLMLHAIGEYTGEQFYSYIAPLMKLVQRYTKEHNSHSATVAAAQSGSNSQSSGAGSAPPALQSNGSVSSLTALGSDSSSGGSRTASSSADILRIVSNGSVQIPLSVDELVKGETPLDILLMLLLLLRDHISRLGDQRRSFLTHIIQLVERSSDAALLHVILAIVREWVMEPPEVFPTIKEKAMLMSSMMCFVHGSASASDNASRASVRTAASNGAGTEADAGGTFALLERKYLGLVLEVYNDPRFTRSEMTMRLEQAFLSGMQSEDSEMRGRFLNTFDANMPNALSVRLNYLLETQNWESVSSTFWLQQCLPLIFASVHQQAALHAFAATGGGGSNLVEAMDVDSSLGSGSTAKVATVGDVVRPLSRLVLLDTQFAYSVWVSLFPLLWQGLGSKEQHDLTSGMIRLLAKPYHQAQTGARPNVIQALLDGFCGCQPAPRLPPQLLRYLGQTYCAWYPALSLLETKLLDRREIEAAIFDRATGVELGAFDALTELYTSLAAKHYFYGAWKRHCQYRESHVALAYEQLDDWAGAQAAYERAQTKARGGVLPFSESEYCLWETRWVEATRRLQSWDMLLDLGLHESLPEIELDAGWRVWDWNERGAQVRQLLKAAPTEFASSARARFYEAFLALSRGAGGTGSGSKSADFQRMCKEGIRACLQQWNDLPAVGTPAHTTLLHMFQLMVELGDASNIYASLSTTKADNLEAKSGDLKSVLQTWRERLPNNSDPINIWSDLIAWRQHVFKAINDVYVPFISQQQQQKADDGDGESSTPAPASKGTQKNKASRKGGESNGDSDAASKEDSKANGNNGTNNSVLTSYAYRGYHEMAWIINRFAHVARLHGLVDVCINSLTRIYTLPNIEIQEAFLKLREQAKCYYHRPDELQSGLDVISNTNLMYFSQPQKAEFFTLKGQFLAKLSKLDEANHAFATGIQFDLASHKAWAAWGRYNDERFCNNMPDTTGAVNAISCYMQAAGLAKRPRVRRYLARTLWLLSQDDAAGNVCAAFDAYKSEMPTWYWIAFVPQLLAGLDAPYARQAQQLLLRIAKQYPQALYYALRTAREEALQQQQQPSLAADELMPKLKTAHPLLALSMETMIDHIVHRLKPCPEEDIYRLVHALLADSLQQLHAAVMSQPRGSLSLVDTIVANTCRVALSLPAGAIKTRFEQDFGSVRDMDLCEYVTKMYQWQQMLRRAIRGRRPRALMLSMFGPLLVEFEQQKFEDVEVPGQYLRLTDSADDFVRIERFIPTLEVVLRSVSVARMLTIRGSDGSIAYFAVQHFTTRHNHQEERWVQLYRNLDAAAEHDRDAWEQRRLAFHLPTIVSLAPHIRLVQEKPDSFTLQDVYDSSCARSGTAEIGPALHFVSRLRSLAPSPENIPAAATALFEHICQQMVPSSLLADDVRSHSASPMDYWLYREHFTFQLAVSIALTYIIASAHRTPAKLSITRTLGNICLSELVPTQATPGLLHSKEPVPFRLTPAIQSFVTELGLEGILPFAIHRIAQRLTEPDHLLRDFLDLYVRDELMHMPSVRALAASNPSALAEMCDRNVKLISFRANQLAETLPAKEVQDKELSPMQPLIQMMVQAVAPANLAKMDFVWMPWL